MQSSNNTKRLLITGITSTDISRRFLIPKDVIEAIMMKINISMIWTTLHKNALHNCV